jgi:hypothetical protein
LISSKSFAALTVRGNIQAKRSPVIRYTDRDFIIMDFLLHENYGSNRI